MIRDDVFTPSNRYYDVTADRLRKRRKELKLTQADVAAALGYRANYVSKLETGVITQVSAEVMGLLSAVLKF